MKTLALQLANHVEELERLSTSVSGFLQDCRVGPETEMEVNLVLEEVFINIVTHGRPDFRQHAIALELAFEDGELTIRVEDNGIPFDPAGAPPPELDKPIAERSVGGLGVHLVRQFTDSLRYERVRGVNRLVLTKKLAARLG